MHSRNRLIINSFAKGHLLRAKRWPFIVPFAVNRNAICRVLRFIRKSFGSHNFVFEIKNKLNTPFVGHNSLCPHVSIETYYADIQMFIRPFVAFGHNKLCPCKGGVLFNVYMFANLFPSNRFADEPFCQPLSTVLWSGECLAAYTSPRFHAKEKAPFPQ